MSSPRERVPLSLLAMAALFGPAAASFGQSPELTRVLPFSARPGETISLTLHGKDLLKPEAIWTNFESTTAWETPPQDKSGKTPTPDGKSLAAKLTLARTAPLGIGFLRLPTATGFSGPLLFLVDDLPLTAKSPRNGSPENAQLLTLPTAVEGASDTGYSQFYRIAPKQGEPFSVEVYAGRIGSKMDPLLRLLDKSGKELARTDDTQGLAGDCRLRYTPTDNEPLLLEIRDATFAGGVERFYHLRAGDFPLVTTVFPPVATAGATTSLQVGGTGAEALAPIVVQAPDDPQGVLSVPVRLAPDKPAAFAFLRVERGPVVLEDEKRSGAPGQTPPVPCVFAGRLTKAGERDAVQIEAKKDEQFTLTPITRDVGSPAVLYVAATDEKGTILAENDAGATGVQSDVPLQFRAPRDGVYTIRVEDVARRGGPGFVYGLRVEKAGSKEFDLSVGSDRFLSPKGGSFTAKVTARRRGINGPINLELASGDGRPLPQGVRLEQNTIEQGKNETMLKVSFPGEVPSGTLYHVRICGSAKEGEQLVSATATAPKADASKPQKDQVSAALLSMPFAPRLLRETFPVCVGPEPPDFFKIELTSTGVDLPRLVGKHSFVVRQTSLAEAFEANAQLKFVGLPEGVSIKSEQGRGGRIKGQVDFICEITGPETIEPGTHTFQIIASADFKGVHKEVLLPSVPLRVVQPLGITGVMSGPLAPGGSQKLKIVATRYAEADPQPITVHLSNLPSGISGPETIQIPLDKSELTVELRAAAHLPDHCSDSLVIAGVTRVKDADVSIETAPVRLEVKK
jgi:hypothetical protein